MTLNTGVMMSFDHRNKLHFTIYIHIEMLFKLKYNCNITVLLYLGSNKCSPGEKKCLFKKCTFLNLLNGSL